MNSSDEESLKEDHGEVFTGMFTEGCTAPVLLSRSQVAQQRAAGSPLRNWKIRRCEQSWMLAIRGRLRAKWICVCHKDAIPKPGS
jgi:hypothetical protein